MFSLESISSEINELAREGFMDLILKILLIAIIDIFLLTKSAFAVSIDITKECIKNELNRSLKLDEKNPDKKMFITTITREYNQEKAGMPTPLISHTELKQLKILLSALCNGKIFSEYDSLGIKLNDSPQSQVTPLEKSLTLALCSELIAFHEANMLKNVPNVVIFNEMFFSKSDPLEFFQKEFILDNLRAISAECLNTIFCPNFLYIDRNELGDREKTEAIAQMKGKITTSYAKTSHAISLLFRTAQATDFPHCRYLINESYYLHNAQILTRYRKTTYFREADPLIEAKSVLYNFGNGFDEEISSDVLSKTLLRNITTEICFDLDRKIRNNNGWKNEGFPPSNLHIIQSNTIDPEIEEVPQNKYVTHVDPELNPKLKNAIVFYVVGSTLNKEPPVLDKSIQIGDSVYYVRVYMIK